MKYLKIVLSILLICVICAISVAGVNYFTAPKIEQYKNEQRLKSYREIFPELDGTTSEIFTKGKDGVVFKSSFVNEKVVAKDKDGKQLGYCVATSGKNSYGPISLTVGIDVDGKLIKVILTENGQTGGRNEMINTWVDKSFNTGMTQGDIDALKPESGATFGSKLVKDLINAGFAEAGIMSAIQEELVGVFGDSVDMGNTITDNVLIYPQQINIGYEVKNGNNEVLGYYYKLKDNTIVALNANKEPLEASDQTTTKIALVKEEINSTFNKEVAVKYLFGEDVVLTKVEEINDKLVNEQYTITKNENLVATMAIVSGTVKVPGTEQAKIELGVVITPSDKLYSVFLIENGQTSGRDQAISAFIGNSFNNSMSGDDTQAVKPQASATVGSELVKELIANAFESISGVRPQKPVQGYDEYYAQAFANVDLSKKTVLDIKDEKLLEAVELKDSSDNVLGKAFILTDTETEFNGVVEMMVSIDKAGKISKVIIFTNSHSAPGIDMSGFGDKFTSGMGLGDIDGVANISGASLTSSMIKSLIKKAFALNGGAYNEYYEKAFAGIDLNKSTDIKKFNNSAITDGIVAKNANGEELGKIYIVKLSNTHAYHIFMVAIAKDGKVAKVLDIESDHGKFEDDALAGLTGSTMENIDKVIIASGTYSKEIAKLAVKIALVEFGAVNENVIIEQTMKEFFPKAVWAKSNTLVESSNNKANIKAIYDVKGNVGGKESVEGTLYKIFVSGANYELTLLVGLDTNKNIVGVKRIGYKNNHTVIEQGAFGDNAPGYVDAYLATIKPGSSVHSVTTGGYQEGNAILVNLVSYAFSVLEAEINNKTSNYDLSKLYDFSSIYAGIYDNTDLIRSDIEYIKDDSNVLQIFTARDYAGKELGKVYLVYVGSLYSHNYIAVAIKNVTEKDKVKTVVHKFVDVQNDHAALAKTLKNFEGKTTLEEILAVKPTTGGSYSIDIIRQAAEIAFAKHGLTPTDNIVYEQTTTQLFHYWVEAHSHKVYTTEEQAKTVIYGYVVKGIEKVNGKDQTNSFLGYSLIVKINEKRVALAFDKDGNYMGGNNFRMIDEDNTIKTNLEAIKDKVTLENVDKLANYKEVFKVALEVTKNNAPLTKYDGEIFKAFPSYSTLKSEKIKNFKSSDVNSGLLIKDASGNKLGYAYEITLTNLWSEGNNVVLVILDKDGKYKTLFDIEWHHAQLEAHKDFFKPGMSFEQMDEAVKAETHGTMTKEMVSLAIKLAICEATNSDNLQFKYESLAKKMFPGMIIARSKKLTPKNNAIKWAYNAFGPAGFSNTNTHSLGNVYVVESTYRTLTLTIMFTVSTEGRLLKSKVYSFNYSNYGYISDETIAYAEKFLATFEGLNLEDAIKQGLSKYTNLLIDKAAYDALLTVLNDFNGKVYEASTASIYKPLISQAFGEIVDVNASTKIEQIKDNKVLEAYNVVSISGKKLGKVLFVDGSNTYAEAYYMVSVNTEGKLTKILEISNNHGSNQETCLGFVNESKPMTYEDVTNTQFTEHSFTFEQVKLAAKIALVEANGLTVVDTKYETAAKSLLPYMVWQHSKEIKHPAFKFGMLVKGTIRFGNDNCFLGYVFVIEANGLEVMVSFDSSNRLFPVDGMPTGNLYPNRVVVLSNTTKFSNEDVIKYFSQYQSNITDKTKLEENNNGLDLELRKAINAKLADLLKLAGGNLVLSFDKFEGADLAKSEVIKTVQPEVIAGTKYNNAKGETLGYAMTIKLTNVWSEGNNIFVILLNKDATYKTLFDIEYHHGSMVGQADDHGPANIDYFKPGWTAEDIDKFLATVSGGTMTKEMAGLGIKLAMNEVLGHTNTDTIYEAAMKSIYQNTVTTKCVKLTAKDQAVKWAYEVKGVAGLNSGGDPSAIVTLGYAYVVELNGQKVMVAITDNKVKAVYNFADHKQVSDFVGLDLNGVKGSSHALKDLVLKAFAELGGNN